MDREKGVAINEDGVNDGSSVGKQELLGIKLRRGISLGKRGGPLTPVPTWKLEEPAEGPSDSGSKGGKLKPPPPKRSSAAAAAVAVSARKLGANLWEIQDLKMSRRGGGARRCSDGMPIDAATNLPPLSPRHCPQSAGSLRRHVAASLIQQHKLNERNRQALQPVSPATYSSSMEVTAVNHAASPSSSLDVKLMLGEEGYSLKTSTELLKVLNRIWSLEEQHASNVSLVKALKVELKHAQARVQELMHEQHAYRHEMDDLLKQVAEDKLIRKKKEQDRMKAAIESIRDELEDERRLRRRSEGLHRKLGKELSDVKAALSKALKDLDREKEANDLLEDLCDEFAKGIVDYELEVRELKQKPMKDCDRKADRLVVHMSEAWLDERLQMKIAQARGDLAEKSTIIGRLSSEIMTFLQARRSNSSANDIAIHKNESLRRQSLESVHFNGNVSAPQDADDDDSIASDLHCFELNLGANDHKNHDKLEPLGENDLEKVDVTAMSNLRRKKVGYYGKPGGQNSFNSRVESVEQNSNTKPYSGNKVQLMDRLHGIHSHGDAETKRIEEHPIDIAEAQKSQNCTSQEHGLGVNMDDMHTSNPLNDNLTGKHSEFCEGCKDHPGKCLGKDSRDQFSWRCQSTAIHEDSGGFCTLSSPVRQWKYTEAEISECSSKLPKGIKENTLKAKLLEARLEGQHARLKVSKGSSISGVRQ